MALDALGNTHSHVVLLAHVVWSTRGKAQILSIDLDPWLHATLRRKAVDAGCRLVASGATLDHVHVLVRLPSTVTLATVTQRLKGASSYECNERRLLDVDLRWQDGYWAESIAPSQAVALSHYVASQRAHHSQLAPPEPWEAALEPLRRAR